MSLTEKQREVLLNGPGQWGKRHVFERVFGGPCQIMTAWRRHRAELLEACPPGRRPWGFWMVERRFKQRPSGELGELRAIVQLNLYRDAAEAEFVERRMRELGRIRNGGRHEALRVA